MPGAAAGDHRGDALVPDLPAVLVMVIAPVGVDPAWPLARRPRRPRTGGIASIRGMS